MNGSEGPAWRRPPAPPVAAPGRVHLWRIELDADTRPDFDVMAPCSPDERARAAQFVQAQSRRRFIVRRAALRSILGRYLCTSPASISFSSGPYGKPALGGDHASADVRFNASHSAGLALIAVTRGSDIGVDIERVRPVSGLAEVARQVFAAADVREVMARDEPDARLHAFCRAWCRQEAFAKATGAGLGAESPEAVPDGESGAWSIVPIDVGAGFEAAVAVACRPICITRFHDRGLDPARD